MRWRKSKQTAQIRPKQKSLKRVYYARFSDRVKALIIDLFMVYMPILYLMTYVVFRDKKTLLMSNIALFSGIALYGIIYAVFLTKTGQTPGKKAYNLKVVDSVTYKNISFFRAVCRFIAFLFTWFTIIGIFFPFYTKRSRALHDIICRTVEIEEKT